MANEWVKVELYGQNNDGLPIRYTIADGVSVSKGALLQLTDARQASGALGSGVPICGVAAEEKVAGDGATSISVWTQGIFEASASGAITVGQYVTTDLSPNYVKAATAAEVASSYAILLGVAQETATNAEGINVKLQL